MHMRSAVRAGLHDVAECAAGFLHCLPAHRLFWRFVDIADTDDRFDLPLFFSREQGAWAKLLDHDDGVAD